MDIVAVAFSALPTWLMGVMAWLVALANWHLSKRQPGKLWPKRIKALTWGVLGLVYIADHIFTPAAVDIRIYYRVAYFMLVLGEVGYHYDVLVDIALAAFHKVKKLMYE